MGRALAPGESTYAALFVGATLGGWLLAEPGRYRLQACLHVADGEDVVSSPLDVRVAPPGQPGSERLGKREAFYEIELSDGGDHLWTCRVDLPRWQQLRPPTQEQTSSMQKKRSQTPSALS